MFFLNFNPVFFDSFKAACVCMHGTSMNEKEAISFLHCYLLIVLINIQLVSNKTGPIKLMQLCSTTPYTISK